MHDSFLPKQMVCGSKWKQWVSGRPLIIPVLFGCLGIIAVEYDNIPFLLGLVVSCALLAFVSRSLGLYTCIVLILFSGLHGLRKQSLDEQVKAFPKTRACEAELLVVGVLKGDRYKVRVLEGSLTIEDVKLLYHSQQKWQLGDKIHGEFWVKRPDPARNPGGFDATEWMRHQGMSLQCSGYGEKVGVAKGYSYLGKIGDVRDSVKERLVKGVEDENAAKVIQSMFLGERFGNDDPVTVQFRLSGAMHVFAVSGLHVMLIAGLALFFLRLLSFPQYILIPLVVLLMVFYTGLTGWGTPAIRATVMASVFLGGFMLYRKANILNTLAVSSIILLGFDSYQLFTVSFLLTYGVVLAIVMFTGFWERRFAFMDKVDPFLPPSLYSSVQKLKLKLRRYVKQSAAVSFAAWMGSAPLIAFYFKMLSPVALLIGVPIVALLTLVIWLGVISVGVSLISSDLSVFVNRVNAQVATVAYKFAGGAAGLKYGHYVLASQAEESVEIFDMKQGGAVFFNLGDGLMLDCGGKSTRGEVRNALRQFKRNVGEIWISHHDASHYRGIESVVDENQLGKVMLPKVKASVTFQNVLMNAGFSDENIGVLSEGYSKSGEDYRLEVIYDGTQQDAPSHDDKGIVVRLKWKSYVILFTNDMGFFTEQKLLEKGVDVRCDVLICGKHGEQHSPHEALIQAARPKVVIATSFRPDLSQRRSYGWRSMLDKYQVKLLNQSDCGAVSIRWRTGKLVLLPMLGEEVLLEN